jgi:hypothetical protein
MSNLYQPIVTTATGDTLPGGGNKINSNFQFFSRAGGNASTGQSAAEVACSVIPGNSFYDECDIRRYIYTSDTGYAFNNGSPTVTDYVAAYNRAKTVCAQTGRSMSLAGLTMTFGSAISFDPNLYGIEGQSCTMNFPSLSSGPAITIKTAVQGFAHNYVNPMRNFVLVGPSGWSSGTVDGIQFGGDSGVGGTATGGSTTALVDLGQAWSTNQWAGGQVTIGTTIIGILSNSATTLNFSSAQSAVTAGTVYRNLSAINAAPVGALSCIEYFDISQFRRGLVWSDNTWLNDIGRGNFINCVYAAYYPSGLANSGENIHFGCVAIGECTHGIYLNAGTFNIDHISFDYNNGRAIDVLGGGSFHAARCYIENGGSATYDGDYWLHLQDVDSSLSIDDFEVTLNGTKTAYPFAYCLDNSSAKITVRTLTLNNVTEANYDFGYFCQGRMTADSIASFNQTSSSGTSACVTASSQTITADGGFTNSKVIDWLSAGTSQEAVSASQTYSGNTVYSGTNSLAMAPTSSQTAVAARWDECAPGVAIQLSLRMKQTGTASTDSAFIGITFMDQNGNNLSLNAISRQISTLPTTWTRYALMPFGVAPPGTCYCRILLSRTASGGGNSDGNGVLYWDDIYLVGNGGVYRPLQHGAYPPRTSVFTANASFTLPKGLAMDYLHLQNTTANAITGFQIGTSSGASDVFGPVNIGANAELVYSPLSIAKPYLASTGTQTYFVSTPAVSTTNWNSGSVTLTVLPKRVLTIGY